jgi:carbamoyl-phosphate synthase small subunit
VRDEAEYKADSEAGGIGTRGCRDAGGVSRLVLEDGTVFPGESVAADGCVFGEAVFTTSMSGYQETVTDPSYAGQIVCFTAPMVGNYGVAAERSQSDAVHATAVVMRETGGREWTDWLRERGIVALSGVDTRSVVLHLRERGAMRAAALTTDVPVEKVLAEARAQPSMEGAALVAGVSPRNPYTFARGGDVRVAVVDYGIKRSILRLLQEAGAAVDVFPHDVDADTLSRHDGVLLGNGPGDPAPLSDETGTVEELLGRTPVLGVCLGHQLLALATGHETFKLPFGHRGANHPVVDHATRRVLVTSQNHGFAVAPGRGEGVSHTSLYDGTVEGLRYPDLRARSAQFHPEASPGPHDGASIIAEWVEELRA